ncbi:hypothetical protein JM93_00890 [Roseibium hamelinense]|uniref:Uncharacterized protein n=1 Tax=Roseibium hamelinense TaxID=150831 RepID=A0A562TJ03_9HYPH|nr:hypothetical protein JM93_00890 [Roseibium hamelinense]
MRDPCRERSIQSALRGAKKRNGSPHKAGMTAGGKLSPFPNQHSSRRIWSVVLSFPERPGEASSPTPSGVIPHLMRDPCRERSIRSALRGAKKRNGSPHKAGMTAGGKLSPFPNQHSSRRIWSVVLSFPERPGEASSPTPSGVIPHLMRDPCRERSIRSVLRGAMKRNGSSGQARG